MKTNRTFIIADGENLILRYQALIESDKQPAEETIYEKDLYVWNPKITSHTLMDVIRVSYYTTCIGDDAKLELYREKITSVEYQFQPAYKDAGGKGRLCPHVFKKENRSTKTKSVDINITIDALRHTYNDSLDTLYLLSGDGDYIPLIEEVMRQGKQVIVGAFSNGLNPRLKHIPDRFINLDLWMFRKQ